MIDKGWNIEDIVTSDSLNSMFAILSNSTYSEAKNKDANRVLVRYQFDKTNLFKSQKNISLTTLGLNNS